MKKWFMALVLAGLFLVPVLLTSEAASDVIADFYNVAYDGDYNLVNAVDGALVPIEGAVHLDGGVWVERGTTNFHANPSFETNDTGWSDYGTPATSARSTARAQFGIYSYMLVTDGTNEGTRYDISSGVYEETTYTLSLYIWSSAGTVQLYARNTDNTNTSMIDSTSTTSEWVKLTGQYTTNAGQTAIRFMVRNSASGATYYIDGCQVEIYETTYCDGSLGPDYEWAGTAHASTSNRITTTIDLAGYITDVNNNGTFSYRLQWTPAYSSTETWPSDAFLFDTRGTSNNNRTYVKFDPDDDAWHVFINGVDRFSPAASFAEGEAQDVWLSLDFNGAARLIVNGAQLASYNIAALSPPTGIISFTLGSDVYGQNHINALVKEFGLVDHAVTTYEATSYTGQNIIQAAETSGVALLEGLVGYWGLDETSGTRYDAHGGYDLTDNNSVLYGTGVISNAAAFNDANFEYLSYPYDLALSADSFTWAGWYSATAFSAGVEVDLVNYNENRTLGSIASTYMSAAGDSWDGVEDLIRLVGLQRITPSTWHHVVFWQDVNSMEIGMTMDGETYRMPIANLFETGSDMLRLGEATWYMNGLMDEWGFWDRVLTDEERAALYAQTPYTAFTTYTGITVSQTITTSSVFTGSALLEGILAHWPLDEEAGTRYDIAGANHHLAHIVGAPASETGKIYDAVTLDGDDALGLATSNVISGTSYSVAGWVRTVGDCTTAESCPVVSVWGNSTARREWRLRHFAGYYFADFWANGETVSLHVPSVTPPGKQFYMFGLYYDMDNDTCGLYINDTFTTTTCMTTETNTQAMLYIGTDEAGNGYLTGNVDNVTIWDRVLTPAEWGDLYNEGIGLPYSEFELSSVTWDHAVYLPLVGGDYIPSQTYTPDACDGVTCPEGQHCAGGICVDDPDDDDIKGIVPIDYDSASWQEWADMLNSILDPIFTRITEVEAAIAKTIIAACGHIGPDDQFTPSGDDVVFSSTQTTLDRVYNMGLAMGRPAAYIRLLQNYDVIGLNYLTLLVGFMVAAFLLIALITGFSISVRVVIGAAELLKWLYDWVPFKAT